MTISDLTLPQESGSPGLFPSLGETFYLINFSDLTVERVECEEYSPVLFRRKGSRIYESSASHSQQIAKSIEEGERRIIDYLEEKVKDSWDEYMAWKRKLTERVRTTNETTDAEIKTLG